LIKTQLFWHKLTHWEYWPYQVIYLPIAFIWLYFSLKAKSFFFFNAANPSFKNGGFMMASKNEIYKLIPQKYYPKTVLIPRSSNYNTVLSAVKVNSLLFPVVAKPDAGLRGSAVKKINSFNELFHYHQKSNFDYLLQDLIPYSNEMGIFYVRLPTEKEGKITGIVSKEFLTITGDGMLTIKEIITKTPRYLLQLKTLENEYGNQLNEILKVGEQLTLVPYGNHCRGAKFTDISYKISPKLNNIINAIATQINGFYFGRFDVMYNTIAELENGKNFAIVELNGAASEPTHIYDPKHSIFYAWKVLAKHFCYMCKKE
jgi:hypothetical protein